MVLFPLLLILPLYNLKRVPHQLLEQIIVYGLQVDADPVFGAEMVVGGLHAFGGTEQFGDAFGLALHHYGKFVEVAVAEGVAADVEYQQGVAAGHLRKRQFLLHLA